MDPIERVDESRIRTRAGQCAREGNIDGLGSIIAEVVELQRTFLAQVQQEEADGREAQQSLAAVQKKLAFLDEGDARQEHAESHFRATLHGERARAAFAQHEACGSLLKDLRRMSETLQAAMLTQRLARQATRLQAELTEGKKNLAPLRATIEQIYSLVRQAEEFNMQSQTAKIPTPALSGDPGIIHRLGDLRLILPPEWHRAERNEEAVHLTVPIAGHQAGDRIIVPRRDADMLVSGGFGARIVAPADMDED